MPKIRNWPLWALIFLCVVGPVWMVETSTSFKDCLAEGHNLIGEPFLHLLGRRKGCLSVFVDQNEGVITALATLMIAVFTLTLWWSNRTQVKHMREVERAYIWGGGPLATSKALQLTVNNYGKTPGLLTEYAVGFCSRTNIPPTPQYNIRERFHDWIPPIPEMIRPIRIIEFTQPDPLIYGRFWFRDVWGADHSIGFVLVTITDPHTGQAGTSGIIPPEIAPNISPAYTEWH
jgi:hypothetical protein